MEGRTLAWQRMVSKLTGIGERVMSRFFSFITGCCVLLAMMAAGPGFAISVPANDESFVVEQPDGSSFLAISRGDEWLNWRETASGYAIAKSSDGFWYYVIEYDETNSPVLSAIPANKRPLPSFRKHLKPCRQTRPSEINLNLHE